MLKTLQLLTLLVSISFHRRTICLMPTVTGYNPAAGKTVDEYRNLDATDESLARWKASLGLNSAASGDTNGPKVCNFAKTCQWSIFRLSFT